MGTTGTVLDQQPAAPAAPATPVDQPQAPPPSQPMQTQPATLNATVPQAEQPAAPEPVALTPVKRGGLAGIVDEFRDALAGPNPTQVMQDAQGNKYVKSDDSSGSKWERIAGGIVRGAAAGYAAGQGHSGIAPGAAEAGIKAGDEQRDKTTQQNRQNDADVNQAQLAKFNFVKLQHDLVAQDFELAHNKVIANRQDIDFSQAQEKRQIDLGSVDLGHYPDYASFAEVQKQDPDFWKNVYGANVVRVADIDPETGERKGIRVFLQKPDVGNQMAPKGTQLHAFNIPDKGKAPAYTPVTPSVPMTNNEVTAFNAAQEKKMNDYVEAQQKAALNAADVGEKKSSTVKNYAEAAKDRSESVPAGGDQATADDIHEGLASGRYMMGKDIPLRTSKDQATAAQYTAGANAYSMKNYGLPYSPEIIRQESKFAEQPKTQAFLTGIDKMVGTPGSPGQLDQVLDLAKKAGIGPHAPLNETKLWIQQKLGDTAAKNFEEGLSDTQTALGTLIGNPLLGSGESDMKLKTAQKQFGSNVTLKDLQGAVDTTKQILERGRADMAKNNRYIQQRYGQTYSPQQQPQQQQQQPGANANAVQPGEATAKGADGSTLVVRNGKWVPATP
jgi:hypothetical protein